MVWCGRGGNAERRVVTERADAEQRRRHFLHSHRRPRSVDGRLAARVRLQVQATGRPQKGPSDVLRHVLSVQLGPRATRRT